MQLATANAGPLPQRFYQRKAVHPMVWAILFSVCVHSVLLLQTFLLKSSQSTVDNAKVLAVRWIAAPPTQQPDVTARTPVSTRPPNTTGYAKEVTKTRALKSQPPATANEASRSVSQEPSRATPTPRAGAEPGLAYDNALQAVPPASPSASRSTDADPSAAPTAPKETTQIDLSQASLARAARQANAASLAYKARGHTGLEPEPQGRVFAKSIAATAIPSCWSHTQDGEGQALVAPSGNLLLLPLAARDAVLGKCKVIP
jgi:hypothetical protein